MSRKLPPDRILRAIIRFGFRYTDIADRFDVSVAAVSQKAQRLGFAKIGYAAIGDQSSKAFPRRFRPNMHPPASRYFG